MFKTLIAILDKTHDWKNKNKQKYKKRTGCGECFETYVWADDMQSPTLV